ncbi:6-phospho-3-hexuloisomerase [Alicyclobacillus fastidiosus]|uniref:6-phospho-3-hexuloisomerase n=1 Tax=Alicyclobacillus fastidiosus TaxID=392011 RepID=A0ABY6ZI82_9BACL|nr:6-phospho-3-hexuloisomerase [Alicyclobacillus fastidiosus]WAH42567.1 6-phospho-3-hexuloisomerase [Alicyclobacillus fastidiosus]GMA64421.1 3-hexulose-6-phosphate isomerase [Alicyclobacillus fastidiosus]
MTQTREYSRQIIQELTHAVDALSEQQSASLIEHILQANKVFVAGAGRSGLMMTGFAMRLMHLNLPAYVVGQPVTPSFEARDLLIIGSGSGETQSLVSMAEKAKKLGGAIALVTTTPQSTIGRIADVVVQLRAQPKHGSNDGSTTIQPMGSLFEQCLLLYCDALVLSLMELRGATSNAMFQRHANLE